MKNLEIGELYEFTYRTGLVIGPYLCLDLKNPIEYSQDESLKYLLMDVETTERVWWTQSDVEWFGVINKIS